MVAGLMVGVVALAACAAASINCRVACRECRDAREPRDLLAVYCAMCEECKDRRREREWLIARKQDLEKEADSLRKPDLTGKLRTHTTQNECPPVCIEPRAAACPPCPAANVAPPMVDVNAIPFGCPTPPPCEEETTTTPRPTCPAIPHCVRKRPTLPSQPYYQPAYQPPQTSQPYYQPAYQPPQTSQPAYPQPCAPCVNMCPCPDSKTNGESVIIGVPEKMI